MFRPRRERREHDRWLPYKIAGFAVGAALGLGGMAIGSSLLVQIAIGVLALSWLLQFAGRGGGKSLSDGGGGGPEAGGDGPHGRDEGAQRGEGSV